ncbi:helix-turn-helix domain-containing protein [Massilia aquatica]|uniref:AraC family transcriptional regulator n=1 Tax=Massilia aquatica TaxID=2609000 RepID=A0ABX0MLY7_9BURK|nr:AraC family transcriptional regulator [Massilia aquatica]
MISQEAWVDAFSGFNIYDCALHKRTLRRRFLEQTGTSTWLETSALSVEQVANATGFGTSAALRACFGRQVGTSPQQYRQSFRPR